jgi:hypothetical protein
MQVWQHIVESIVFLGICIDQNPKLTPCPFVIEAHQTPLWNAVELSRVMDGNDDGAPTLANMLRKASKAVRDNSSIFVRNGPRMLSPAETKSRQQAIIAQADLLDRFANGGLSAMVRDQLAIEQVFEKLICELGTKAPDALVSGIAHAFTVFERYPLVEEESLVLNVKLTGKGWTVNTACSNAGERWTATIHLALSEDAMIWTGRDGTQTQYSRCR